MNVAVIWCFLFEKDSIVGLDLLFTPLEHFIEVKYYVLYTNSDVNLTFHHITEKVVFSLTVVDLSDS